LLDEPDRRSGDHQCDRLYLDPVLSNDSAGTKWMGGTRVHIGYTHYRGPNSSFRDCAMPHENGAWIFARSRHPGSVNVLKGDGSAHAVSDAIDQGVWRAAGTMNGLETTSQVTP
jgi:prepilin-type processing-associated H-X9-DG protein